MITSSDGGLALPAIVATPRETFPGERRVAITPRQCEVLRKSGIETIIEEGAGSEAGFPDEAYISRGARIGSRDVIFREADLITQVRCLGANPAVGRSDIPLLRHGQILIGFGEP